MATIDSAYFRFSCPCGTKEIVSAQQSHNTIDTCDQVKNPTLFAVKFIYAKKWNEFPTAVSATCKHCNDTAKIETKMYSPFPLEMH